MVNNKIIYIDDSITELSMFYKYYLGFVPNTIDKLEDLTVIDAIYNRVKKETIYKITSKLSISLTTKDDPDKLYLKVINNGYNYVYVGLKNSEDQKKDADIFTKILLGNIVKYEDKSTVYDEYIKYKRIFSERIASDKKIKLAEKELMLEMLTKRVWFFPKKIGEKYEPYNRESLIEVPIKIIAQKTDTIADTTTDPTNRSDTDELCCFLERSEEAVNAIINALKDPLFG